MRRLAVVILPSLLALGACGGSPHAMASDLGIDAGPPSGYLMVGTFTATETDDSSDPSLATVNASLTVTRAGNPVDDLQVLINPPLAIKQVLVEETPGSGIYLGNWIGYHGNARLTVNANRGRIPLLQDVVVAGPSIQHIDSPAPTAILDSRVSNPIDWSAMETAAQCTVATPSMTFTTTDTGRFDLPAGALPATAADGGPQSSWVEVTRGVVDTLPGVAPGSQVVFAVQVQSPVMVAPLPYVPPDAGPDAAPADAAADAAARF